MNINRLISPRHQGQLALLLWGAITALLLRHDLYNLDEGAAKSLLLSWSIADQVASSVITFGTPDMRALLFLPIGFLWTGNVFAAKILTAVLLACAVWLLYGWKRRHADAECALLASGLLIISPLALEQIDSLSPGIYLLAVFALGAWLNDKFRAEPKLFGGWHFAQLLACAVGVSLHPAGLAYPLSLLWSWRDGLPNRKQRIFFLGGIVFVALFVLLLRMGWPDLNWFQNPIGSLGAILMGTQLDGEGQPATQWLPGGIILAILAVTIAIQHRALWSDLLGRTLLIGVLVGALAGDSAWGMIALAIILYFGLPILLRPGQPAAREGFIKQRGWVVLLIFVCATFFMRADRAHYEIGRSGELSAQDQLIKALAGEAASSRQASEPDNDEKNHPRLIVASQWPSRTMIACKCDTLPLPPAAQDPRTQLAKLHGITHLLLDPKQTANVELARNLSLLGGEIETLSLQPGGVLLHVKETKPDQRENKS
jgi:hypothetical protein